MTHLAAVLAWTAALGLGAAEIVPLDEVDPTLERRRSTVVRHEVLPAIREAPIPAARNLPHSYHDQVRESLQAASPGLEIVVDRRSGLLGQARYSLLAYRSRPTGHDYQLSACVVRGEQAWRLELAVDEARFDAALLAMLQRIRQLGFD